MLINYHFCICINACLYTIFTVSYNLTWVALYHTFNCNCQFLCTSGVFLKDLQWKDVNKMSVCCSVCEDKDNSGGGETAPVDKHYWSQSSNLHHKHYLATLQVITLTIVQKVSLSGQRPSERACLHTVLQGQTRRGGGGFKNSYFYKCNS